MKTLRVSVCLVLWLVGMFAAAQNDEAPSEDLLDFLASWDAEDEEWLDNELENENREQANTSDEEVDDAD
jgi:hypothetical protein